jgi:Eco57I restriction-modification methylase
MPRRTISSRQLGLINTEGSHDEGWWSCHGIFTGPYLRQQMSINEICPPVSEIESLYEGLRARWLDNLAGLRRRNEAYTRTKFLDPSLSDLAWYFIPETSLPDVATRKKPDYCLFADADTERSVAASEATRIFRASSTVLEAKKVEHPLDEVSKQETPGWFPSQQIQDYLRWATDDTGQRFFRWGILTNGNEWRLYSWDAAPNSYFTFHLAHGGEFCPLEEFRLFVVLFRPASFDRDERNRCLLDDIREQSLSQQVELEANLRRRIFDVLEELAEGFYKNPANGLSDNDLPAVYGASLIFLYRLLFVLYAESRGLLPAKARGAGANRRYREEFSLTRFIDKLRDPNSFPDDAFDLLYAELLKLFHLINGTNKAHNDRLNVTRYNGGLFNPDLHPDIERWWVGENRLANVLRQLIFAQPPARQRTQQQVIATTETIDYGTLEVRQLGDIYEGLLGGQLRVGETGRLDLINERGTNQREGIFYTPDWVVLYLIQETLGRLLDEIETSEAVQRSLNARSKERQQDNSFALAVLRLNVLDPAMGSGHFLVRSVEYLAQRIVNHPTTKRMTEKIVATGSSRRSREEILAAGRIPVSAGVSQERAEIAYWRRRVVEACIYGVDRNPLAVELTKLSLWLTCIAIDEPLNFLDHHLHCGNSLLWADMARLYRLPYSTDEEEKQAPFNIGDKLSETLSHVISETASIESEASTEMEVVKNKENRWKEVRASLKPYLDIADIWLAALDGLAINHLDYRMLALYSIKPDELSDEERRDATRLRNSLEESLHQKLEHLQPFHWELEFPDVFYQSDGQPLPEDHRGFDAILGNPPYISTHTSSEERWRAAVQSRFGYLEDLYVHFSDLGFRLLRTRGMFGFIVSDTFFTLTGKLPLRELLQTNRLAVLGQCDPFDATVDAAIFAAQKGTMANDERLLFVQARYGSRESRPEKELPKLPKSSELLFSDETPELFVSHGSQGCLRYHEVPIRLFREAARNAFFEPRPTVLRLYAKYNSPLKELADEWWEKIADARSFKENLDSIRAYHASLRPGNITLIGLIAEGAQGMRTGNNARFIGYLAGTPQARVIQIRRERWTRAWTANPKVQTIFLDLLKEAGGDPHSPTENSTAWEVATTALRTHFSAKELGFSRTDLYRIAPTEQVASTEDFIFAWKQRKSELLMHWNEEPELKEFWEEKALFEKRDKRNYQQLDRLSDEQFCELCQDLLRWRERENERRRKARPRRPLLARVVLGLKPSEAYEDPEDAPRIATIYNGLSGRGLWLPFRKGDPEGNRWVDNEPLYIDWSRISVDCLSTVSEARWQGHSYFLTSGVTWTAVANHVAMKARFQEPCVFDADSMRLTPFPEVLDPLAFLALLNSDIVSFFKMKFVRHTQKWEIGDLRALPIVIPSSGQADRLTELAQYAIAAKRSSFRRDLPDQDLVVYVRRVNDELQIGAPRYLRPPAQLQLVRNADDCLGVIEHAVNWEAEKLYGVEGCGPFDEF